MQSQDKTLRTVRSVQNLQFDSKTTKIKRKSQLKGLNIKLQSLKLKCKQLKEQSKTQRQMLNQLLVENENLSSKTIQKVQACNNYCSQIVQQILGTSHFQDIHKENQIQKKIDKSQTQKDVFSLQFLQMEPKQNYDKGEFSDRSTELSLQFNSIQKINTKNSKSKNQIKRQNIIKSPLKQALRIKQMKEANNIFYEYLLCVISAIIMSLFLKLLNN